MKKSLLILVLAAFSTIGNAQQEYSYTFFGENRNFFNPAAAGTAEYGSVTGLFRKQWVGVDGSPTSGGLTFDMPFKNANMGIGGMVYQDKIGVTNNTQISAMYAYHLTITRGHFISFGVNAGMDLVNSKGSNLTYWDANDQILMNDYVNVIVPHVGFGVQYFFDNFYVGLSIPRLISVNSDQFTSINMNTAPSLMSHYYLSSAYNFEFRNDLEFKPSILLKYVNNAPLQADISLSFLAKKSIGFGVAYKSLGFLSTFMSYTIKDMFVIGYGFDFSMNPLQGYSKGTHEAMLQWRFGGKSGGGSSRL